MSFSTAAPAPALRRYIMRYWSLRATFARPETITLLPGSDTHLVMYLGAGVRSRRFGALYQDGKAHLVGAMLHADEQVLAGEQHLIGVSFLPGGLSCFRRQSMREVTGQVQPFAVALPRDVAARTDGIAPWLDRYFLERLQLPSTTTLHAVLADIEARKGNLRVDDLLKRHALTGRTLERIFDQKVGMTPKELIDLARFRNALDVLHRERNGRSLMELAWDCGYYDNAHLTREFKRFLGEAPSRVALSDLSKSAAARMP